MVEWDGECRRALTIAGMRERSLRAAANGTIFLPIWLLASQFLGRHPALE
jgi:hypothetical protein